MAPPPGSAFNDLEAALEAQGLTVTQLPKASLDGAETGVDISGSQTGSGRSFASEGKATGYADEVAGEGDKTKVVVCCKGDRRPARLRAFRRNVISGQMRRLRLQRLIGSPSPSCCRLA